MNTCVLQPDFSLYQYNDNQILHSSHYAESIMFEWCYAHEIDADLIWAGDNGENVKSIWGFKHEKDKTLFALRWA